LQKSRESHPVFENIESLFTLKFFGSSFSKAIGSPGGSPKRNLLRLLKG
jgi:hypothetical protein